MFQSDEPWPCWNTKDRKSTRLNSSYLVISYAVFCLKKKKNSTSGLPPLQKKKMQINCSFFLCLCFVVHVVLRVGLFCDSSKSVSLFFIFVLNVLHRHLNPFPAPRPSD